MAEKISKVLVADDDEPILKTTSRIIGKFYPNVEIDSFTDAAKASEAISKNPENYYSVFISDIDFNGKPEGLELIAQARKKSEKLYIIASSGRPEENEKKAIDAGANYFLPKPYSFEKLTGILDNFLPKK